MEIEEILENLEVTDISETVKQETQADSELPKEPIKIESYEIADADLVLRTNTYTRINGAPWMNMTSNLDVVIAGCGGIGSNFGIAISRINPYMITVYDYDKVDAYNLAGQFFTWSDCGTEKSLALANKMHSFGYGGYTDNRCSALNNASPIWEHYQREHYKVMAACPDSMDSRKAIWTKFKSYIENDRRNGNSSLGLYIDGRLAAEHYQLIIVPMDDKKAIEKYENEYLFDSSEAEETVCSYKQTSYSAMMLGSVMANAVINWLNNKVENSAKRNLPFRIEYAADLMLDIKEYIK